MCSCTNRHIQKDRGQATVEAAFLLPLTFLLILLIAQPAIILYDRCVMESAAAEGCRLLKTRPLGRDHEEKYVGYVKRRLASIPPADIFHVHDPCSWEITIKGNESSDEVSVTIQNKQRLLPLVGAFWRAGFPVDSDGCYTMEVKQRSAAMPSWATSERTSSR